MTIERHFLGWSRPLLPAVVAWLRARADGDGVIDLSGALVVTPGARAGRRLIELLTADPGGALFPPRLVTPGELPEALFPAPAANASTLDRLLAWNTALHGASVRARRALLPVLPPDDDLGAWLDLAATLDALRAVLAGGMVASSEVPEILGRVLPDFSQGPRWKAIAALERAYLEALARRGLVDPHEARRAALASMRLGERSFAPPAPILLIGVPELNRVTRALLLALPDSVSVEILVHAPSTEAASFDELGLPIPSAWRSRPIAVPSRSIEIVDRVGEEAHAVLKVLGPGPHDVDRITIGLGDEAEVDRVLRILGLAGLPARPAAACRVTETRPFRLLAAWGRLAETGRWGEASALLRHPDFEAWVEASSDGVLRGNWLTRVDRAALSALAVDLTGPFLDPKAKDLRVVGEMISRIVPGAQERRPLAAWAGRAREMLSTVYGSLDADPNSEDGRRTIDGFRKIGQALHEIECLPDDGEAAPATSFAEFVAVLRRLVEASEIPAEGGGHAVELLGWLELGLDDAPCLFILGCREGMIPLSATSDAFLPDSMRGALGLADNATRYARDAMLLTSILASRDHVSLVASRRDDDGNPLVPSRLLLATSGLAGDDTMRASFFAAFYDDAPRPAPRSLLAAGAANRILVPYPETAPPLEELRVTAFRDYIACPYRFYLKHVVEPRLEEMGSPAGELDASGFGTLAHEALADFGRGQEKDSTEARRIDRFLRDALDRLVLERYGRRPPVAFRLQIRIMKDRFERFAARQAAHAVAGWRIGPVEEEYAATLIVDGAPFKITGHIDRIDSHPELGHFILDYKTGDAGKKPETKHRAGPKNAKEWIDLQLPLYRLLAHAKGFTGACRLGYVLLGRSLNEIAFAEAIWTEEELALAEIKAAEVIRNIRAQIFWPPADPPAFADGFETICLDEYIGRRAAIETAARLAGAAR